jgi:hypothetical protein
MMTVGISHKLLVTADRGVDHIGLRARSVFRKPYRTSVLNDRISGRLCTATRDNGAKAPFGKQFVAGDEKCGPQPPSPPDHFIATDLQFLW